MSDVPRFIALFTAASMLGDCVHGPSTGTVLTKRQFQRAVAACQVQQASFHHSKGSDLPYIDMLATDIPSGKRKGTSTFDCMHDVLQPYRYDFIGVINS